MFLNLAFVPKESVKIEFLKVVERAKENKPGKFNDFIIYFSTNYIGSKENEPLYEIQFWNCYARVINNLPRTINCL
jgi:hypothetical protein